MLFSHLADTYRLLIYAEAECSQSSHAKFALFCPPSMENSYLRHNNGKPL